MAGLFPAIHVFLLERSKTWMPGTRPDMTAVILAMASDYNGDPCC
jgi:hypothetical protein